MCEVGLSGMSVGLQTGRLMHWTSFCASSCSGAGQHHCVGEIASKVLEGNSEGLGCKGST